MPSLFRRGTAGAANGYSLFRRGGAAAAPAAAAPAARRSIYQPGSTAGIYPTAVRQQFTLPAGAAGGAGGGTWNTTGGGLTQQQAYRDPGRQVGYNAATAYGGWGTRYERESPYAAGAGGRMTMDDRIRAARAQQAAAAGGGAAGGAPQSLEQQLLDQYTQAYNQGVSVNEQRYSDILGGYRDRYGTAMGMVDTLGGAERAEVDRIYTGRESRLQQGLVDKGLGTGSIAATTALGVDRERARAMQEVEEGLTRERLAQHTGLSGETLGFMERREDTYPDISQLTDVAMRLGNVGQGAGGGGATTASPQQFGYQIPQQSYGQGPAYQQAYNQYRQQAGNAGWQQGGQQQFTQQQLAGATDAIRGVGQDPEVWRRAIEGGSDPRTARLWNQLPADAQMTIWRYYQVQEAQRRRR